MRRGNRYCRIVLEPWFLTLYMLLILSAAILFSFDNVSSDSNAYIPALAGFGLCRYRTDSVSTLADNRFGPLFINDSIYILCQ